MIDQATSGFVSVEENYNTAQRLQLTGLHCQNHPKPINHLHVWAESGARCNLQVAYLVEVQVDSFFGADRDFEAPPTAYSDPRDIT